MIIDFMGLFNVYSFYFINFIMEIYCLAEDLIVFFYYILIFLC